MNVKLVLPQMIARLKSFRTFGTFVSSFILMTALDVFSQMFG